MSLHIDIRRHDPLPHTDAGAVLPSAVRSYVDDVVAACRGAGHTISVIVFGSAAIGGYQEHVSDTDLLLVLSDDAEATDREHIAGLVAGLEVSHGVTTPRGPVNGGAREALRRFADRMTANQRTFFICTRADLLSGEPQRILGLAAAQAIFVDRAAIPSIVASGITVWGEHLLESVPLPPIRRLDVAMAFFGLFNTVLLSVATYAILPDATKYAMDALKRSIHNCYFTQRGERAPLDEEVAYFERLHGRSAASAELIALRREYRPSWRFVFRCLPALVKLHLRTATDVSFPRQCRAAGTAAPPNSA